MFEHLRWALGDAIGTGLGSGFIVRSDGVSRRSARRDGAQISVATRDGTTYPRSSR